MQAPGVGTAWRVHPLDGAVLWFDPRTGTRVRWEGPETRAFRRRAPRVVLFGVTNRCNLRCHFCSRDAGAASDWTEEDAFEILADLSEAGVLEVAFGGGEPLLFPGFESLLARLRAETPLAVHFTTNGVLLDPDRARRLTKLVGEIRLSIYADNPWEIRARELAAIGARFGANVIVTPALLRTLPDLLERLAGLACRDVAILGYVGPDPAMQLSTAQRAELAQVLEQSPISTRISVCFGDNLHPLPRLSGGDCGAGTDFVVLTSDRRLSSCSFSRTSIPVESARDVLDVWRARSTALTSPVPLYGCTRTGDGEEDAAWGVRIWRSFSANNSGECVLVGRFEKVEDAERYVTDLLPGFDPGERFSEAWKELLASEGVRPSEGEHAPDSIAFAGRSVLLHTEFAVDDDYPSLRELLWKRGGRAVYSGIHEHEPVALLTGIRTRTETVEEFTRRGPNMYGLIPVNGWEGDTSLARQIEQLEERAAEVGGPFSAELVVAGRHPNWSKVLSRTFGRRRRERLWARFPTAEAAGGYARTLGPQLQCYEASQCLLLEADHIPPRAGLMVHRHGGVAEVFTTPRLRLTASFFRRTSQLAVEPDLVREGLLHRIRGFVDDDEHVDVTSARADVAVAEICTRAPGPVIVAMTELAASRGLSVWIEARSEDVLAAAIERITSDLAL